MDDKAEISDVLIRYATGIDQRDWALFRTCWTADVEADYGWFGQFSGVDEITDVMIRTHQDMGLTHHLLSNIVIDLNGDRADVRSYVHAVLVIIPDDQGSWVEAIGHYDDEFVRTDDGWRIARRTLVPALTRTSPDFRSPK